MDKKYVTKDFIINHLRNNSDIKGLERVMKLESIFAAEARVMDNWSYNFFQDLNSKERELRYINSQSPHSFINDNLLDNFNSLSETLISLFVKPLHIDILVTQKFFPSDEELFEKPESELIEICKNKIISELDKQPI